MYIDELRVENYRCLGEVHLDNISPITVLVGRNNTGKSALLEAIALISTAGSGWQDTLGNDLIKSIISRRGGWEYSDYMIKLGEKNAKIKANGDKLGGMLNIWKDIDNVPELDASELSDIFSKYINNLSRQIRSSMMRGLPPFIENEENESLHLRGELLRKRELQLRSRIENIKKLIWEQIKISLVYNDSLSDKNQYAIIIGEQPSDFFEPYFRYGFIRTRPLLKSKSTGRSKTIFHLTPNIEYLNELKRRLAQSGELLNLIQKLREKIKYFRDLREMENKFFIFLKGLKRPVPLESMGDGFRAQLAIFAAIFTAEKGLVLMEEPEIRLHPGYMNSIADQIAETAIRGDIQYILSTHNLELIEFLLVRSSDYIKIVRMYRMEETSQIDYEVLTGKEAIDELEELKMDLRGI